MLERGDCAGVYVQGLCNSTHRGMPRPVLSGERMQNMRTDNASSLGRSAEQRAGEERMPEPQIVIVVNSLTEAHKLERELVRDRQNACGYRPRQKDECRFCKHVGRYSSYTY